MKITKGMRVEFENGRDTLRGTVASLHSDPKRPDMEETWTVFADSVLKRTDTGKRTEGGPLLDRDGKPRVDLRGKPKFDSGEPIYHDEWIKLVDDSGLQACDENGIALHKNFAGDPLQLVKHGVPVPFRVRARRMKLL
jgi:hypothetical protein